MTLHNALVALTFRGTDDVDEVGFGEHVDGDGVTELVFPAKSFELGQVALGSNTRFGKVADFGLGQMLFLGILEAELEGVIAIGLDSLHLGYFARTYFDNSARHVLAVGTENGCHSDFFSN